MRCLNKEKCIIIDLFFGWDMCTDASASIKKTSDQEFYAVRVKRIAAIFHPIGRNVGVWDNVSDKEKKLPFLMFGSVQSYYK